MDKPFAMMVRDARIKIRMTQQALADRLGVDVMTLSRWECGAIIPSSPKIVELAMRQIVMEDLALA
jgi:transcriptional regulator with XRE-family HTH domain